MRQRISYLVILCLLVLVACQKGIHWEFDFEGTLLKDSAGNCMPVVAAGIFTINTPTNDSNFLTVNVDVTAAGNYSIKTDSVDGFMFKASGTFNNIGIASVKLTCAGTPVTSGPFHFNIYYNSSICEADVTVLSDTIPAAVYTLQGSPGNCMNDTVNGSYLQANPLDTSNKIIISVDVTTPGKYSIVTNTVNGYTFSGSGVFTTAGIQPVIIEGSGTPVNAGTDMFILNAGNNTCSFSVTVLPVVQVNNNLHFPLTAGSYWTYVDPAFRDTVKRYVNGDTLINDTSFIRVSEQSKYSQQNYFFYFDGANYYEYGKIEKYTSSFGYSPPVYGLIPFLKENINTGLSWESAEYKGTAAFGQTIYFKYGYNCFSGNASKVVNSFGFKDVYIVSVYPELKSDAGIWGTTNEVYNNYYAKGVGLIYEEESTNGYPPKPILKIVDWKVN